MVIVNKALFRYLDICKYSILILTVVKKRKKYLDVHICILRSICVLKQVSLNYIKLNTNVNVNV